MKKIKIKFALIMIFAALAFLAAVKNAAARVVLIKGVRQATGLNLEVEAVKVGLLASWVRMEGLKVLNPPGFDEKVMAYLPEVYVDYDPAGFFAGKVHLSKVRLQLAEFTVVRSPAGELNVNSISSVSPPKRPGRPQERKAKASPQVKIDVLELKIGSVLYKDYTQSPAAVSEYRVNINERYENITDVERLVKLVVARAVLNTAVSRLTELDINNLKNDLSGILQKGKDIFKSGAGSVEEVGQAIQGVAQELENILK